jgi:L-2-hydroxycarboxylate dehydrogenase (NAD+)
MTVAETQIYPIDRLHEFSARVFMYFGVPRDDAHIAADLLTCADLRGVDSHGVARLHVYCESRSPRDGRSTAPAGPPLSRNR